MFSDLSSVKQAAIAIGVVLVAASQVSQFFYARLFSRTLDTTTVATMAPAALLEQDFTGIAVSQLKIGQSKDFTAKGSNGPTMPRGKPWALPAGQYTPRQIVEANAPLLETVLHHLGPSPRGEGPARDQLIDNLASNLNLNTRESSITIPARDVSRAEMADQAVKIGKKLVQYAQKTTDVSFDPNYEVRSPCEGHLLKPHVAALMFGPRSLRHLMQIYNEYLHQMVLLRDALLPFENYEDVIIPITAEPGRKRGLRHIEQFRASFLTEMMTKQVTQRSTLKAAQALLAPGLSSENACAFQYKHGVILPSFLSGGNSPRLLRYIPTVIDSNHTEVTFQNELEDYYRAPRTNIKPNGQGPDSTIGDEIPQASLLEVNNEGTYQLQLALHKKSGEAAHVDVGQIARGRRYAHVAAILKNTPVEESIEGLQVHSAWDVLTQSEPGLVMPTEGIHLIKANSKVELHGLLGKLYPDNVVIIEQGQSVKQALEMGKPGLPDAGRFAIQVRK